MFKEQLQELRHRTTPLFAFSALSVWKKNDLDARVKHSGPVMESVALDIALSYIRSPFRKTCVFGLASIENGETQ